MPLFDVLASQMDAVESGNQLRLANAVAHGKAIAECPADKRGEVDSVSRAIMRRAFPSRWEEVKKK